jgi:hypothetical protein
MTLHRRLLSSPRMRLLLIVLTVVAIVWLIPESPAKGPMALIVLGLPLLFGLVPKNWFYGLRTSRTMSSDESWYIQNRITGVAMLLIGVVWLVRVLR